MKDALNSYDEYTKASFQELPSATDREEFWRRAAAKGVKVYMEFPSELPRNATPKAKPNAESGGVPCLPRPPAVTPSMVSGTSPALSWASDPLSGP